jgi:hypothetical protein
MKKQIVLIHGGETFETYEAYLNYLENKEVNFPPIKKVDWKNNLEKNLGVDFEVILPEMPSKYNAKYLEWKIWFERLVPFFDKEVVLAGHSLGGLFLVKYLSENNLNIKIKGLFLIAPPYEIGEGYREEDSLADFGIPKDFSNLDKQVKDIFIYHSKDDSVVPFDDLKKYERSLPKAKLRIFEDRKHFWQERFEELERDIKSSF